MIQKAYKYRLFPTSVQEEFLQKCFGCSRFIYNAALETKKIHYECTGKSLGRSAVSKQYRELKHTEEFSFLKEVPDRVLEYAIGNLETAYKNFFTHGGYPKYKSKHKGDKTCQADRCKIDFEKEQFWFPKIGWIDVVLHRRFEGKMKTCTIRQKPSGRYYISILVETKGEIPSKQIPTAQKTIGVDLGLKQFATLSDGTIYANPRKLRESTKKLHRLQKELSRRSKEGANWRKTKTKIARLHEQITNQRNAFLHEITAEITRNPNITTVAIEDLNVKGMMAASQKAEFVEEEGRFANNGRARKKGLNRSIADAGWGGFRKLLTYKCDWHGVNLVVVDRWFPSSQKCCECGYQNKKVKSLKIRNWNCPKCESENDRDVNAAKNLKTKALKLVSN